MAVCLAAAASGWAATDRHSNQAADSLVVTTLAAGRGGFRVPTGVAAVSADQVYVVDNGKQRIGIVGIGARAVSTLAGNGRVGFVDGAAGRAEFAYPVGIAVDGEGNVYVADSGNEAIRTIAARSHSVETLAGDGRRGFADGAPARAEFNTPLGVAIDSRGAVYVADAGNDRIRIIAARGGSVSTLAGDGASGFADGPAAGAEFDHPTDVAVDRDGNVYVADSHNNRVRMIAARSHRVSTLAGNGNAGFADGSAGRAEFDHPTGVAVDPHGDVYVADTLNHRIRLIAASSHTVSTLAGDGVDGSADGPASRAEFRAPYAIAVDALGEVWVADVVADRIRLIDSR